MLKFSLIVLAKTESQSTFEMNLKCFNTFIESANKAGLHYEIVLIESNQRNNWQYQLDHFKLVIPKEDFNFHKFLNIGIKISDGDFYILSNNDVIFDNNWLEELIDVYKNNSKILSFSPYDFKSNKLAESIVQNNEYVLGYEIQKHIAGWCIVTHKRVFEILKKLDERFDFYYADFDYAMQLQKYNIKHALLTKSLVAHLHGQSSTSKTKTTFKLPTEIPEYIIKENWTWVLENEKMIEGIIKYHKKWGSRKIIKIKLIISNQLQKLQLGYFNRFIITNK